MRSPPASANAIDEVGGVGSQGPFTAPVAQLRRQQGEYKEDLKTLEIAQRAVPQCTSW
jgi:hypothetical protein